MRIRRYSIRTDQLLVKGCAGRPTFTARDPVDGAGGRSVVASRCRRAQSVGQLVRAPNLSGQIRTTRAKKKQKKYATEMVFVANCRVFHAAAVPVPVGRQLFRAQMDTVRTQQVPSRPGTVRRGVHAAAVRGVPPGPGRTETTVVHSPGQTRENRQFFPIKRTCAIRKYLFFC